MNLKAMTVNKTVAYGWNALHSYEIEGTSLFRRGWSFCVVSHFETTEGVHLNGVGLTECDKKLISVSEELLKYGWREVYNTIRHEVAHAIVAELHGTEYCVKHAHGAEWREACKITGARPQKYFCPRMRA